MALTGQLGTIESGLANFQLGASVSDPLIQNLTQELGLKDVTGRFLSAAHIIPFVDEVLFELLIDDFQSVSHNLSLTHEAEPGLFQNIIQNLGLSQTPDFVVFGPIEQNLGISHFASFVGPQPATASNTIALTHLALARFDVPISITQNLGITDFATDVQKHELNLIQDVFGYVNASPRFIHELGLSHTVQISAAYVVNPAHANAVEQAVTFYIDDGTKCPQNDFNDFGTLGELPFTVSSGAKLSFKGITGTQEIVFLRNPELDDRDRLGFTRINRESRGGELQVFRDPTWPEVNTLQGTVVGLKKEDSDAFLQFLEDHLGEEVSLNDWHGRYWRGVIINPGEPTVEDSRDRWTVAFEFEGVEMPGPDVIQALGITDNMVHNVDYTRSLTDNLGFSQTVDPGLQNVHFGASTPNNVQFNTDEVFYSG